MTSISQRKTDNIEIRISNFERYLANIVLAGSFAERNPSYRVSLWVENISKLRQARGRINLDDRISDELAREDAIHEAARFGVRVHPRLLEVGLDTVLNLGAPL